MNKQTFKIIIVALILLVLSLTAYLIYENQFQADTNGNVFRGQVFDLYEQASDSQYKPVSGADVILVCNDEMPGTARFQGSTDGEGRFAIQITNPKPCDYQIYAGSGGYNYSNSGLINFVNNDAASLYEDRYIYIEKEVDIMHSTYFGSNFAKGYEGGYRLSNFDYSFFRNKVTLDHLLMPKAPKKANVTMPITIGDFWCDEYSIPQTFNVEIKAYAINSNWQDEPSSSAEVGTKTFQLSCQNNDMATIEFDIDLSSISQDLRYYTWVNGFRFDTQITNAEPAPYFIVPRSEDNNDQPVIRIEYSEFEDYKPSNSQCSLTWPTENHYITSGYGQRIHPITKKIKFHTGIDLRAPDGAPIFAADDGIVIAAGSTGAYGLQITVQHCNGIRTSYSHLKNNTIKVKAGDYVKEGTVIAGSDDTGFSKGSHLHFEVSKNNERVNPTTCLTN